MASWHGTFRGGALDFGPIQMPSCPVARPFSFLARVPWKLNQPNKDASFSPELKAIGVLTSIKEGKMICEIEGRLLGGMQFGVLVEGARGHAVWGVVLRD